VKESATGGEFETASRVQDYLAGGLFAGDSLDGIHGHGYGEKLADVGFVDVDSHGLGPGAAGGG
jgi:hypothetical protein